MDADINTLYKSDYYQVLDFKCKCIDCNSSSPEYASNFCISFIRKGNFLFNVFRNSLDSHTGRMLLTKPGYEHTVTHTHTIPDECTILEFTHEFYEHLFEHYSASPIDFLGNNDIHSLILKTSVETEYLHHEIFRHCKKHKVSRLTLDMLVMELVHLVMKNLSNIDDIKRIKDVLKKNHLNTIEQAKAYLVSNFTESISLKEIADHCCISVFHFSRIFKIFTSYSPNNFLVNLRLKHAEVLLKNTTLPITEICFSSGFNSLEYFSAVFSQKYSVSPSKFRTNKVFSYLPDLI